MKRMFDITYIIYVHMLGKRERMRGMRCHISEVAEMAAGTTFTKQ